MYNAPHMNNNGIKIQKIIAKFLSSGSSLEKYLQRRGPLTPLQLRSVSLTVSMMQIYLDICIKGPKARQPIGENAPFSSAAAVLGRLGGSKGGKARAKKLSREERTAIARLAATTRWAKSSRPRSSDKGSLGWS